MKQIQIVMVRIYLTDDQAKINTLLKRLKDWEKVRGVTVFEALTGFGRSGLPLPRPGVPIPIVVEFFEETDKVEKILEDISGFIDSEHIVTWPAQLILDSKGVV